MIPEPKAGLEMGMGATTNSPRSFFLGRAGPLDGADCNVVWDELCTASEALVD